MSLRRDRLGPEHVAPLVRALVAEHLAGGRRADLADVAIEAGTPQGVRWRVPGLAPTDRTGAAVIVELGPSREKLAGCPCTPCRQALARLGDIPAGRVRLFVHDAVGERVFDMPRGWFDGVVGAAAEGLRSECANGTSAGRSENVSETSARRPKGG